MQRIVVGVDGSREADRALRWAVEEAVRWGATVDVLHAFVVHPYTPMFGDTDRSLADARLADVIARNGDVLDRVTWTSAVVDAPGAAAAALVDAAEGADLVVVGARGAGGFQKLALGSTGYRTAAHAPAPVAVVPATHDDLDGRRRLMVGVDDTPAAARALRWALTEAERRGTGVTVVHGYLLPIDMTPIAALNERLLNESREHAESQAVTLVTKVIEDADVPDGVDVDWIVEIGTPAGVLLDDAEDHLLVVGTRGRGSFARAVFGSVSQQVLHHAHGPVVVVP